MLINSSEQPAKTLYHLMVQTIVPRPIAWVLSQNKDESLNLAPFSYFNGITSEPPLFMISVGKKSNGEKKDSWVNIEERSSFVLNISSVGNEKQVTDSSESLAYGESELEQFKITTTSVESWPLPRVSSCKIAFLCKKQKIIEVGTKPQALILGEIQSIWLDDAVVQQQDGKFLVDAEKLNPLARLGSDQYGSINIL